MNPENTLQKLVSRKELAHRRATLADAGGRLVLTNGCFDLLHVGHVRYLQAARLLGDALAVGLNSDSSTRRLKGRDRPITPQDERAEILAALHFVDYVTIFGEDTATELVASVHPHVYAKGGDYSADPSSSQYPVEARVVGSYGGSVVVIPYTPGRSTTELIRRICC
jgi:D-glycero-beta-D-manno-heptose 1-phosphate adenylyltransferase